MVKVKIQKSRRTREKLQCLYENLMSNNLRRTAVLKKKKKNNCKLKLHSWGFYRKKLRALHGLEDLESFFKILYTFVCKKVLDKYMENLKQASGEI